MKRTSSRLMGESPKNKQTEAAAEEEPEEEEVVEDCMLCLEAMHDSDHKIPMLCPLDGCPFNYCSQCVWSLLLTSSQPYQEASDGSKQLKVPLQCPQCRTRYPHRQVVQDVLLLRRACRLQPLFFSDHHTPVSMNGSPLKENSLKASDLSAKQDFLEYVTWESLQESWTRVDRYLKDRSNPHEGFEVDTITDTSNRIPLLPRQWKEHLLRQDDIDKANGTAKTQGHILGSGQAMYDLVDPTLFQGMDETMTLSEQEFLSKLLVSGSVPNLMQAAQILHGMLQLMLHGGLKARQNSSLNISGISTSSPTRNNNHQAKRNYRMLATGTNLLYPDMDPTTLRKRFPLPLHMPRWMVIPVYHPDRRGVPLHVKAHKYGLEITSVKGSAGQQGIRKGDVITHINEEPCDAGTTTEQFNTYMQSLYETNYKHQSLDASTVTLVVNAHEDMAQELQKRSFEIIHFLTQQRKEENK
ncbi:expressed unknown protein [Seminavis robusta]|uniref:RING-type domain-containing protein n=1 Tax=Seminavis robusta TaxID=568900 RepID=A0A9N8HUA0_9STRA|nr:expressed unknown protein [Seminavis robusta]|eukprot:Sro1628_g287000.1 n/a (468) ;mRNA; f:14228-15631